MTSDEHLQASFVSEVLGFRRGSKVGEKAEYWYDRQGLPRWLTLPFYPTDVQAVLVELEKLPVFVETPALPITEGPAALARALVIHALRETREATSLSQRRDMAAFHDDVFACHAQPCLPVLPPPSPLPPPPAVSGNVDGITLEQAQAAINGPRISGTRSVDVGGIAYSVTRLSKIVSILTSR